MQPLWLCMHFSEWLLSNTLCHMTSRIIVWDHLSTVFAANFFVRIHVSLELPPTFARFVTFLTYYHTIIMLVLHVLLEMFFRKSFIATHDTSKHGDCRFVLLAMMLCVSKEIIFPYQNANLLGKKTMFWIWYVLKVGSEILVESETILTTPSSSGFTKSRLS